MTTTQNPITTDTLVVEFLARANVKFSVHLVGETKRDDWKCDEWRTRFEAGRADYENAYYTGTGHRKIVRGFSASMMPGARMVRGQWQAEGKPQAPSAASVLHSWILDGRAIDQSFADWCANFGYDEDSRKALQTYSDCCEIGRKLRVIFSPTQRAELETLLQDY